MNDVRLREHPGDDLHAHLQHGLACPCVRLFRVRLDRQEPQARSPRGTSGARSPASESGCARRRAPSPKPQTFRRYSSCRASPNSSTPTTDSRFGRETPKTTSRNALQPLFTRVRRIPTLKKWVNSRVNSGESPLFSAAGGTCRRAGDSGGASCGWRDV